MKKIATSLLMLCVMLLTACGGDRTTDQQADHELFDLSFATTYNAQNVARADSAYAVLATLQPADQAWLALFYCNAGTQSFENSQLYAANSLAAYDAATAADAEVADGIFEAYGRELHLTVPEVRASFEAIRRELAGIETPDSYTIVEQTDEPADSALTPPAELPEQTLEEALEEVQSDIQQP